MRRGAVPEPEFTLMEVLVQCDCCDYFSIPGGHDYEICPVCFWEQDAFGVSDPDASSCANHGLSLHEGRKNFIAFGACAASFTNKVASVSARRAYHHVARLIQR